MFNKKEKFKLLRNNIFFWVGVSMSLKNRLLHFQEVLVASQFVYALTKVYLITQSGFLHVSGEARSRVGRYDDID